ncbi:hypothetical protein HLB23_38490 [Nocardia uniformis]|uniref:Uncharacterized protein n=1 Tax=Nocardia uniformis TaxID=53432 RepID=A0A849CCN9_9NOCA|nr:hypothetical protein [Nocardia uniformis]NNH75676.1 hypothetical protein [Nocardia uniformis]
MAKRLPKTGHALADCSYLPPGAKTFEPCIDEVAIPLATVEHCTHDATMCPDCVWQWQLDHLFCEPLPWGRDQ